ncbi:hypothetical protein O9992_23530 [Vibrio lentus]|nr:hypothetical protein [Vibrio lentus]
MAEIVEQLDGEPNPCLSLNKGRWSSFSSLRYFWDSADRPRFVIVEPNRLTAYRRVLKLENLSWLRA